MTTENNQSLRVSIMAFVAASGIIVAAFWTTLSQMVALWSTSGTYTHAFLIVPISLFLVWSNRDRLRGIPVKAHYWYVPFVIAISVGWLLAELVGVQLVKQLAVVSLFPMAVWAFFGTQFTRALWFPMAYLFFMVPMGDSLIPPLQDFTAVFSVKALQWTGLPVFWEGRYISIPTGNFEVAEACSGTRYLFAALAFGALYAYMNFRATWLFLAYLLLSALIPIIANGIRAYGIIMIAHLSDMKYAVGVDHIIYGWMFFGVVIAVMIWLGNWMSRFDHKDGTSPTRLEGEGELKQSGLSSYIFVLVVFALTVAVAPVTSRMILAKSADAPTSILEEVSFGQWLPLGLSPAEWKPEFQDTTQATFKTYEKNGKKVVMYIAYYAGGAGELISSQHRLYNEDHWRRISDGRVQTTYGGRNTEIDEIDMYNNDTRRLLWYWYQIGDTQFSNAVIGKLLQARERIRGNSGSGMVVAISTPYNIDKSEAVSILDEFIRDNRSKLDTLVFERE